MPMLASVSCGTVGSKRGGSTFKAFLNGGNNLNLRTLALSQGWNGSDPLVGTVTADVGSTSVALPALTVDGAFPAGVELIVEAGVYITGKGGDSPASTGPGESGGPALSVDSPLIISNNGVIAGGGGAGGTGTRRSVGKRGGGGAGVVPGTGLNPGTKTTGGAGIISVGTANPGGVEGSAGSDAGSESSAGGGGGGGLGGRGGNGTTSTYYSTDDLAAANQYSDGGDPSYAGYSLQPGGAAGACVSIGNSKITWKVNGTTYGLRNA